jgi:multidrug resistance efflux pump
MPGIAWRVMKRLGQTVSQGEILALIESVEIGKAKAELQQAVVQLRLKRQAHNSVSQAPVSEQQRNEALAALHDAEARVLSAEQTLINAGLKVPAAELVELPFDAMARRLQRLGLPDELSHLQDEAIPGTLLPIVSPVDGTMTQCDLIVGDVVEPSRRLFTIADTRRLLLTLHVSPTDASHV